jgi:hypothetical protein
MFYIDNKNAPCKRLIMYLIQCRDVEFMATFEESVTDDNCPFIRDLHLYAYAVKILLEEDGWNEEFTPIISTARDNNAQIWDYLKRKNLVPNGYHDRLIQEATDFCEGSDSSYEDIFLVPLEQLIEWGAQKLDCDLYMAVVNLDFEEAKRLLELGANPDGEICVTEKDKDGSAEKWTANEAVDDRVNDAYMFCTELLEVWKDGYNHMDSNIGDADLIQAVVSAAFKRMADLLDQYKNNRNEP